MSDYLMMADWARWEVMWIARKPRTHIVCIEFENDFSEALKFYERVKAAKKPMATLRCCNVGFPPPDRLRPRYEDQIVRQERVRKRGKWYKKVTRETVEIIPMDTLNKKGVWWCPYCRELRRFEHWDGVKTDGSFFKLIETKNPMWIPHPGFHCPMCGINQNDSHVARWNPQAVNLQFRYKQRRRSGRRRTRR